MVYLNCSLQFAMVSVRPVDLTSEVCRNRLARLRVWHKTEKKLQT